MNKRTKNLITLLAFTFFLGSAQMTLAYVPGVWEPQPHINSNEPAFTKIPMPYDEPVIAQTYTRPITPVVYNNSSTTNKTVTKTTTKNTEVVKDTDTNDSRELKPIVTNDNGLTALSMRGSGSFMPSSVWQWFIVILLILAIIIIARMLGRSHKHEVHTVAH